MNGFEALFTNQSEVWYRLSGDLSPMRDDVHRVGAIPGVRETDVVQVGRTPGNTPWILVVPRGQGDILRYIATVTCPRCEADWTLDVYTLSKRRSSAVQ